MDEGGGRGAWQPGLAHARGSSTAPQVMLPHGMCASGVRWPSFPDKPEKNLNLKKKKNMEFSDVEIWLKYFSL